MKRLFVAVAAIIAVMGLGCEVTFYAPTPTTVRVRNDMTDLSVTVRNTTTNVESVDLINVTIGDLFFSRINAGSVTEREETARSGDVNIFIASAKAVVVTYPFGIRTVETYTFNDIEPMVTTIESGEDNTVTFDEYTAGVVFSALAKKIAEATAE
jgi:hypothetical protein